MINKIIAISDINVRIYSEQPELYKIGDIVCTPDNKYKFEVVEINNNSITSIPLQSVVGLKRGIEKKEQELKSLKNIDDSFKKIVIVSDDIATYTDEDGITYMGLFQFLLHCFIIFKYSSVMSLSLCKTSFNSFITDLLF